MSRPGSLIEMSWLLRAGSWSFAHELATSQHVYKGICSRAHCWLARGRASWSSWDSWTAALRPAGPDSAARGGELLPACSAAPSDPAAASAASAAAAVVAAVRISGRLRLVAAAAAAAITRAGGLPLPTPPLPGARLQAAPTAPAAPATAAVAATFAQSGQLLMQPDGWRAQRVAVATGRHYSTGSGSSSSSSSSSRGGGGCGGRVGSGSGRAGGGQWRGEAGRPGGGGGSTGSGQGGARDPADDVGVCRTVEELQGVLDRRLAVWSERKNLMNLSAAFHKCGKLHSARAGTAATAAARAGVIAALAPALLPLVPRIRNPGHCSIVLWALAKVRRGSSGNDDGPVAAQLLAPALLQRLADPVLLDAAKPQELANALWALGKLREDQQQQGSGWDPPSSPHLATLAGAVTSRLRVAVGHGFNGQDISNSLCACAKLGYRDSELLSALAAAAVGVARGMNAQELANSLWACAKLGYRDSELLAALADTAVALAHDLNAQELANSLWALGALSCSEPEYSPAVRALCGEALRRLRTEKLAAAFKPQHLSNILIALEGLQLGGDQAALVAAAAEECARRGFAGFNPQGFSNSAWALAKMGYGAGSTPLATNQQQSQQQWYAAAVAAAQRPGVMAGATAQAWANLLYALALVRHQPPPALLDTAGAASALQQGNSQDCANMLWALAVLQLRHGGVEAAVCGRLGELLQRKPESVAVCNSLWALAVLGGGGAAGPRAAAELALAFACEAVRRHAELNEEDLSQLWQAQRALGGEVAEAFASSPDVQAAMEAAVAANRRVRGAEPTTRTQQQVVDALYRLQQQGRLPIASVRAEVAVAGVLGPVDVVLDWSDGRQVAVEVDGPDHFFSNRPRDPSAVDGSTALRNRQLRRALGAGHVLCVPYWEWDGLSSRADQEAYLLRRLQQAVQPPAVQSGALAPAAGGHSAAYSSSAAASRQAVGGYQQQQ